MKVRTTPPWLIILYRGIRAAVAAGLAQAVLLQPDWSNSEEAVKVLGMAFATGALVSLGKWLRDHLDEWFGWDEKSLVAKSMPI